MKLSKIFRIQRLLRGKKQEKQQISGVMNTCKVNIFVIITTKEGTTTKDNIVLDIYPNHITETTCFKKAFKFVIDNNIVKGGDRVVFELGKIVQNK